MTKISAKIVADSIDVRGNRITSYILTYPRMIHAEVMTHRMFSRNAASSRAIPFERMVKMIKEDPFIPIAWQEDHPGMQGVKYLDPGFAMQAKQEWLIARDNAVLMAEQMSINTHVTKQLCNRLVEPFMWYTCLVTATEYYNFFELRCPKYQTPVSQTIEYQRSWKDLVDNHSNLINLELLENMSLIDRLLLSKSGAEIHIQALAEAMWDARNESRPQLLQPGEWHIPFGDKMNSESIAQAIGFKTSDYDWYNKELWSRIKIAIARAARLSYLTFDGEINYQKDIKLHDDLFTNKHMSPFEHAAQCMSELQYFSFVKGEYPTTEDQWGIVNYEKYPIIKKPMFEDEIIGENPNNRNLYGWCNNFRGFIPYRYIIENSKK